MGRPSVSGTIPASSLSSGLFIRMMAPVSSRSADTPCALIGTPVNGSRGMLCRYSPPGPKISMPSKLVTTYPPSLSTIRPLGDRNSPGPSPGPPTVRTKLPSGATTTIRSASESRMWRLPAPSNATVPMVPNVSQSSPSRAPAVYTVSVAAVSMTSR